MNGTRNQMGIQAENIVQDKLNSLWGYQVRWHKLKFKDPSTNGWSKASVQDRVYDVDLFGKVKNDKGNWINGTCTKGLGISIKLPYETGNKIIVDYKGMPLTYGKRETKTIGFNKHWELKNNNKNNPKVLNQLPKYAAYVVDDMSTILLLDHQKLVDFYFDAMRNGVATKEEPRINPNGMNGPTMLWGVSVEKDRLKDSDAVIKSISI